MTTRRHFITTSAALAACSLPLLSACTPSTPAGAPSPTQGAAAKGAAGASPLPNFVAFTGGPKPDFHASDPRITDGYEHFPRSLFKSWSKEPPGTGGRVDVYIIAAYPPPTPFDQNPTWQAV